VGGELDELVEWAYRGEVRGDALFGTMAEAQPDRERATQLATLRLLEVQTGQTLHGVAERLGVAVEPTDADREVGRRMAEAAGGLSWDDFLRAFAPTTSSAIERYRRLRELVDESEHAAVDEVIAHEEALQAFADAALAHDGDPIAPVVRLLRPPLRDEVPNAEVPHRR
jgi:hypothetical protein